MHVEFKRNIFNDVYVPLLRLLFRYMVLVGGAGSGKSIFCAQRVITWLLSPTRERILLIRKVSKTIRTSQYQLIKDLVYKYNLETLITFNKSDMTIHCANGNEVIPFGLDDPEKLKSVANPTKAWIEEATELTEADFTQVDLRLRGQLGTNFQIYLSFNPIDEFHWLNSYFFLRNVADAYTLHTTYKDNRFVDKHYRTVLESIRDTNLRRIYLEGKWGVLQNLIYEPYEMLDKFPGSFDEKIYGLDFGFNNPTALIEIGIKDKEYYLREMLYETGLTNTQLVQRLESLKIPKNCYIYADSAEPDRIEEIHRAGYLIHPADKSVKDGIDYCRNAIFYTLPENENLNKERQSYKYKEDKNGNVMEEPVKFMDHLMDAKRYAVYTHSKKHEPTIMII